MTAETKTAVLVPLADLIALARLGQAMIRTQVRYLDAPDRRTARERQGEWIDARRRFEDACDKALARERMPLPGMEPGGDLR